jgi:hypothetical protein
LTNGTTYTFVVTATNAIGTSAASTPSNAVTPTAPLSVPDAPINVTASSGDGQATISFDAPANDGGSEIFEYTVTSSPDGITVTGTESPIVVTGLSNGTAYTFTVTATNGIGTSVPSAPSNAVWPTTPPPPPTVPGNPIDVIATAGNGQATVKFTTISTGGIPINFYTVTSYPEGITATGNYSPITITGLTNGITYTFTVTATNNIGTGDASAPSNAVTPSAPTGIVDSGTLALKLYPNPAIDILTIAGLQGGEAIKITDLSGRIVRTSLAVAQPGATTLNVGTLPKGVYLVRITLSDKTVKVLKLAKK